MTAPILAVRKLGRTLDMWRDGVAAADIAADVGWASAAWVRTIVAWARKRGDRRAVVRAAGRPRGRSSSAPPASVPLQSV